MSFYKKLEEIERLRMDFVSGVVIPVCGIRFDDVAKLHWEELQAQEERYQKEMEYIASSYGELLY